MLMKRPGSPKDLTPPNGHPSDLAYPKQGHLTPESAERYIRHPEERTEMPADEDEGPVSEGRGGLEMLFYGVLLLAVVAFQLLGQLDTDENGLFDAARVVTVSVDDEIQQEQYTLEGNRVAKPDCEEGEPYIEARVSDIRGIALGRVGVNVSSDNGEWLLSPEGRTLGGARLDVEAIIGCEVDETGEE
ncbi:hypothetical protein [Natronospira sp.]|uniref:hypothetical protein n=1 Tax=Natronospira sp. TaxID=2024970 RepID=UPI0038739A25